MNRLLSSVFACFLLAGCTSTPLDLPELPTNVAPTAAAAVHLPEYLVQVGDVLDIKFQLNPELNETVTVRPDGKISTSLFSDVGVYNRPVEHINETLRVLYRDELSDPRVSVIIRSFAPTRIYVSGEVATPGEFIVIGPALTLTQAIARAGGILNSGRSSEIVILRRGAGEKTEVFKANYEAATQGADPTKDARLAPYDVVFVPKTGVAQAYQGFNQYLQQFVAPTAGISATYNINRSR
jgi:polysaccharide biosynthesis/export protein